MNEQHGQDEFRSHVQRLVAEGKLTAEEAQGLLEGEVPATEPQADWGDPAALPPLQEGQSLHLLVKGYSLTVLQDASLTAPHLSASEEGRLTLEETEQGWRVARVPGAHHQTGSLKAILTVPFVPGHVKAEVNGGNLTLPDIAGEMRAEVNGGNVRMGRAVSLSAEVNGGNLTAAELSGPTHLNVNGGNLSLRGARTLNASVNGGNLKWAGVLTGGDHRVEVNAGNATLRLKEGSSVRLDASVTVGNFRADFPTHRQGGFLNTRHSGQLGGGEAFLSGKVAAGSLKVVTQ
ncbi:hypothetical protein GO986_13030 [Deinococcus sp. HMF7620]|uniref:Adhesin domain-containing protein n=1 Tax=Deinococcus arboris TaxID=2682977 RepID=A0A7C9M778_9DEIO|nr:MULTISPECIES: hypothetical protein [Deinococcus]MBZ9750595.1 hypothetical protein [Deinococcus betulae]MVN87685.1 hypothetical protein [Deinococcus arboris]